jgi:hypothetical protein
MAVVDLQAELILVMDQLSAICRRHGYDAKPMVLLVHHNGPASSMLVGNVNPHFACEVIRVLGNQGSKSDMSVSEAAIRSVLGEQRAEEPS